jgi:hypothetical protein
VSEAYQLAALGIGGRKRLPRVHLDADHTFLVVDLSAAVDPAEGASV